MTTEVFVNSSGLKFARVIGNDVSKCNTPLETTDPIDFIRKSTRYQIESCSDYTGKVVKGMAGLNSLVLASQCAFSRHYPLTISPDIIWITLLNGLSIHINENAEVLRHHFVEHEGKNLIEVRRNEFIMGSPENNWPEVFDEFSHKIRMQIGKQNHEMLTTEYSTTTPVCKASCEVALMDCMKSYFEYLFKTCCGIPYFDIEGTTEDYLKMKEQVDSWGKWDLEWWTEPVKHVLDNLILATKGEADEDWFQHFYKEGGGSGGPFITGWINWLFPYINYKKWNSDGSGKQGHLTFHNVKNPQVGKLGESFYGNCTDCFPPSYSNCPFVWDYFGQQHNYKFIAGLMAIDQTEDMSLRPRVGWAVTPDKEIQKG
jgi:hypothetical protein